MYEKMALRIVGISILLLFSFYVFLQFINLRTYQIFGEIILWVITDRNVVALTFDDAPAEGTEEVLQILDQQNVKATFF
ncbi:polysaccharide deacetylase family protein [Candidatus Roizmanbacteria bacterium]|nr:MAG: polysaccharide deacetylase family protein [Candidatus Roizmanbacteria bacterium]